MTPEDRLRLADLNLAEATREMARWHENHRIEERTDILLCAGVSSFPVGYGNCVQLLGRAIPPDPDAVFDTAGRFFGRLGRGYTLWTRAHLDADLEQAAKDRGYAVVSESPCMLLERSLPEASLAKGLRVERIHNVDEVALLASVEARAYATLGLPTDAAHAVFSRPDRLLQPHTIAVLGRADEEPAAAALAILSHGIAGLYWVATVPEARGRGLGGACSRLVSNLALEAGARWLVLQANKQGEPVYKRLGYREITRYRWVFVPAPK